MKKNVKSILVALTIIMASLLFSMIFSFIKGKFIIDKITLIDSLFWIGIIISFTGGVIIAASFAVLKGKLKRTPIKENVESNIKDKLPWGYIMFISGGVIFFISYYISINI